MDTVPRYDRRRLLKRIIWAVSGVIVTIFLRLTAVLYVMAMLALPAAADPPAGPRIVPHGPRTRPVVLPDGTFRAYRADSRSGRFVSVSSTDGGLTWSQPHNEFPLPQPAMGGGLATVDGDGEIHVILTHARGQGTPAVSRFIDLWHCRTRHGGRDWSPPQRIWEGYCGAVMDVKQLSRGRIVVPFAAWKRPGEEVAPRTGSNYTTCVYSDDGGQTWQLSPSQLTSPCTAGYNGNSYGAIEPTILELRDSRVWMLLRTQTGFLYESYSDDGVHWGAARPSVFYSSTSPAALERLPDGRLVVFWNNCQMPPRHNGAGVYGGRDALHAAISADEGRTWQGFREVYRDPRRNETPPRRGDRGTAYPGAAVGRDGTVVLATGQGDRRTTIVVDPDWITAREQADNFTTGLESWHVWKEFGLAAGFWRDRTSGPVLIADPDAAGRHLLHIRRPDEHDPDCASWNFPAARHGSLALWIRFREGFGGLTVSLTDRLFHPGDEFGESLAIGTLAIGADGDSGGSTRLPLDRWIILGMEWDLADSKCRVMVDGEEIAAMPLAHESPHGISYVRLRSAAHSPDPAGCLIGRIQFRSLDLP